MDMVCPGLSLWIPDPSFRVALLRFASSHAVHCMWSYTRLTVSAVTPSPAFVIVSTICASASRPLWPVDLCSHKILFSVLVGMRGCVFRFCVGVMSDSGGSCWLRLSRHVW